MLRGQSADSFDPAQEGAGRRRGIVDEAQEFVVSQFRGDPVAHVATGWICAHHYQRHSHRRMGVEVPDAAAGQRAPRRHEYDAQPKRGGHAQARGRQMGKKTEHHGNQPGDASRLYDRDQLVCAAFARAVKTRGPGRHDPDRDQRDQPRAGIGPMARFERTGGGERGCARPKPRPPRRPARPRRWRRKRLLAA